MYTSPNGTPIEVPLITAHQYSRQFSPLLQLGQRLGKVSMVNALAKDVKRDTCPLRRSFVERPEGSDELTPLATLLRTTGETGGKGGGLRIALLMSLIWVTARPPYVTNRVAPYWAELLGREDPGGVGARAIRDALHELADRGLVQLHSTGARLEIILCNESHPETAEGDPNPYVPPYGLEQYIPVPRSFWTRGLAGELSGAGIAMYLCSLALTRSDDPEFFIAGAHFDERYGISRSSRKRGLAELTELGVLTVRVEETIDFKTFRKVRRNIYRVAKRYRQPVAWSPPAAEVAKEPEKALGPAARLSALTASSSGREREELARLLLSSRKPKRDSKR